ncbi:MAG: maleylpyruvate isomerase family mycothiol-dependent enzyme [Acidimicrobiales bacterium]
MEPAEHVAVVRSSAGALLEAASGAMGRPVRSCPDWDVAELVRHVGSVWGFAADVVRTGERAERPQAPSGVPPAALLAWAGQRVDDLAEVLERLAAADPDGPCWTFAGPATRRFWARRQAMETALHAWDVAEAAGRPEPIEARVAADGVDELLTVILPRSLGRQPGSWSGQSVHLHRTDGDGSGGGAGGDGGAGEWLVRLGPAGAVAVERGHAKGDVAVRGPASSLYLWCSGRVRAAELPELDVVGDRSLAERWSGEIRF